jgi:hypothetical protein
MSCGGDDCDDSKPLVHPGRAESCDGIDNNCNGMIDEAPAGQECLPGQACVSGSCQCPASGGGGVCAADAGADASVDATPTVEAGGCAAPAPFGPYPGCKMSADQSCDPVCQARCGCNERCLLGTGGVAVCRAQPGPSVNLGESCDAADDRCQPGLLCLQEGPDHPACGAHCYRHCRADSDCSGGAKCTIEVQFASSTRSNFVCTAPPEACSPWGAARCATAGQRPFPTFGCYVMSAAFPSLAVCDCAGTVKPGQACTYEHECEPGSECVAIGGSRLCRRVCEVGVVAGPVAGGCSINQTCTAFSSGAKFGYCQ